MLMYEQLTAMWVPTTTPRHPGAARMEKQSRTKRLSPSESLELHVIGNLFRFFSAAKCSSNTDRKRRSRRVMFEALEDRRVMTVNFTFDYSQDSNGFFNDSSRRAIMELAGHMIGDRLD